MSSPFSPEKPHSDEAAKVRRPAIPRPVLPPGKPGELNPVPPPTQSTTPIKVESDEGDFLFVDKPHAAETPSPIEFNPTPYTPPPLAEPPVFQRQKPPVAMDIPPPPVPPIIETITPDLADIGATERIPFFENDEALPPVGPRAGKGGNVSSAPPNLTGLLKGSRPVRTNADAPPEPPSAIQAKNPETPLAPAGSKVGTDTPRSPNQPAATSAHAPNAEKSPTPVVDTTSGKRMNTPALEPKRAESAEADPQARGTVENANTASRPRDIRDLLRENSLPHEIAPRPDSTESKTPAASPRRAPGETRPGPAVKSNRGTIRWLSGMNNPEKPLSSRIARTITISAAVTILPALVIGIRQHLTNKAAAMTRLVATQQPQTKSTDTSPAPGIEEIFASVRKKPADTQVAALALNALCKAGKVAEATTFLSENRDGMPAEILALWTDRLTEQNLADGKNDDALRTALLGWDAAPGRALSPESLLRVAQLAGKPESVHARIRKHVVIDGRFDKALVYRETARACGKEWEALKLLWPFIMTHLTPTDHADLARTILAENPANLPAESKALVEAAVHTENLPFESGTEIIRLCLATGMVEQADLMTGKLAARHCETPGFLRLAADCKRRQNRNDEALGFLKTAYYRTGDEKDFAEGIAIAKTLESPRDIVALFEHRALLKASAKANPDYADALTAMGEYEPALRAYADIRVASGRNDIDTLRKIARLQHALRRDEDALHTYAQLVKADPAKAEWRKQEFRLLVTLGRDADAITAAERNWRDLRDPQHLAEALKVAIHTEDEIATVRIATEARNAAASADPSLLLTACYHLKLADKTEPRISILSELATRFPERADIAMELATHDLATRRFAAVEQRFMKLPTLDSTAEGAAIRLRARLGALNTEGTRELLENTITAAPHRLDDPGYASAATQAAIRLGDKDAIETLTLRFLAKTEGEEAKSFQALAAKLLYASEKADEALSIYRGMNDEMDTETRLDYACALSATGHANESEMQMARAISEQPEATKSLFSSLGETLPDKAKESYRRALLRLEPKP